MNLKKSFFPKKHEIIILTSNLIKNCFSELSDPLKCLFKKFLEKGVFLDAQATPPFEFGDPSIITDY